MLGCFILAMEKRGSSARSSFLSDSSDPLVPLADFYTDFHQLVSLVNNSRNLNPADLAKVTEQIFQLKRDLLSRFLTNPLVNQQKIYLDLWVEQLSYVDDSIHLFDCLHPRTFCPVNR